MYAYEQRFEAAVEALTELLRSDDVDLLVAAPFGRRVIRFVIESGSPAVAAAAERHGLTEASLSAAAEDVADALSAVVSGASIERFVGVRTKPGEGDDAQVEDEALARKKYEVVQELFDVPRLKRRYWLKRSSKTDLLIDIDWEIVRKERTNENEPPDGKPVTYGLLRLASGSPHNPLAVLSGEIGSLLALDREDVDALVRSLRRLAEALDRADA